VYIRTYQEIPIFLNDFLPADQLEHVEELGGYLAHSFGNEIRLDYGTGHESFLVIFLFCLNKLGIVSNADLKELVLSSFVAYMKTVRKLQTVYMLEPAGSHGVWGLDDFQCLVFLLGAAQLKGHGDIAPLSIHDDSVLREFSNEYLYLDAIRCVWLAVCVYNEQSCLYVLSLQCKQALCCFCLISILALMHTYLCLF
jgi:hypothetical protein